MNKFISLGGQQLVLQTVKSENTEKKQIKIPIHHTFIIDCSGSMYSELGQIRKDLYNKISTILKPDDSVSIIWFSGKGQFGVLLEDYHVNSAIELSKVKSLIDKYLTTVGLTAFKEPLDELKTLISRVKQRNPEMLHTMMFLTDGYDNQWSTKQILDAVENVKEELASATFVEYGWYCNKELLSKMAETVGGAHIFSEGFDEYEAYAEKMFKNESTVRRRYVKLDYTPSDGTVFNIVDGDIITYTANENNEIFVSVEGELELYYFTEQLSSGSHINPMGGETMIMNAISQGKSDNILTALYAAAFVYSRKNNYDKVSEILRLLGDAKLILQKANTFGTQKINELEAQFLECANNISARYTEGYNPNLEPAEDAFCVLDMMELLMSDDKNVWYPRHKEFSYKRSGKKTVPKGKEVSDENKELLKELVDKGDMKAVEIKLQELMNQETDTLEFNFAEEMPASKFSDLTWNETRANLSVQVTYKGWVNLPENNFGLPEKFDTIIYRNYTLVKDGVIYTYKLPVSLSKETFDILQKNGLLSGEVYEDGKIYVLDYSSIPVINRKMVKSVTAEEMFKNAYELYKLQAANSVFTQYKKRLFDNANQGFLEKYGADATKWLGELGLKDYGFNPPSKVEKTGEEIVVNTLDLKIKGLASNVTKADFEKVEKKLASGVEVDSMTDKEQLVATAILEFESFNKSLSGMDDKTKEDLIQKWLYSKSDAFKKSKNKLMTDISKAKFMIIVGKTWFIDLQSRDEKTLEIEADGKTFTCTVEDKMATIKL